MSSSWSSLRLAQAAPCPNLCLISDIWLQNQMLQDRRQDLEAQIRGLRDEVDKGQGRLQSTHEELLLLRRERKEHQLEVIRGAGGGASQLGRVLRTFWKMWPSASGTLRASGSQESVSK